MDSRNMGNGGRHEPRPFSSSALKRPLQPRMDPVRVNPGDSTAAAAASREADLEDGVASTTTTTSDNEPDEQEDTSPSTTSDPVRSVSPTPSEQELDMEIQRTGASMDPEALQAYRDAIRQPPITPESLAELDMPRIINNPKLRHDVNFDRELHFRPNLDGIKGKQKIKIAESYWKALEPEVCITNAARNALNNTSDPERVAYWMRTMGKSRKRLPRVFEVVKDILKTLVPDGDQSKIEDRLDVGHLFQEIDNGVCDLVDLANWLATVIKKHCAPMRDNSVDDMERAIKDGALNNDPAMMVGGLRQLLLLLENMKLDVANHQIRAVRPLLINDTINFQQRYNAHRIELGKLDAVSSRKWLQNQRHQHCLNVPGCSYLDALSHSLMRDLIFADPHTTLTPTFYLDIERLRHLRQELHASIYLRICNDVFTELLCEDMPNTATPETIIMLQSRIDDIVGTGGHWLDSHQNIAVEIVRTIMQVQNRPDHCDAGLIVDAERRLCEDLSPTSQAFVQVGEETMELLYPRCKQSIDAHIHFSAAELQEALVPALPIPGPQTLGLGYGAVLAPPPSASASQDPNLDFIRRFTHIVVLHWQVWSGLVYLAPAVEEDDEIDLDIERQHARRSRPRPTAEPGFSPRPEMEGLRTGDENSLLALEEEEEEEGQVDTSLSFDTGSTRPPFSPTADSRSEPREEEPEEPESPRTARSGLEPQRRRH